MGKRKTSEISISSQEIENAIHVLRGQRVMLDSDLAKLYGVSTAGLNQAVRRNADRFSEDFAFRLTQQEFTALISQNVTSKAGRGGRRKRPWVFTEHGVAMLSSVLRSPTAARVNIGIMRACLPREPRVRRPPHALPYILALQRGSTRGLRPALRLALVASRPCTE